MLELITDLETDVACLLDSFEDVTEHDLEKLQDKLARLYDEYILSLK
jgi:hypothetical protein